MFNSRRPSREQKQNRNLFSIGMKSATKGQHAVARREAFRHKTHDQRAACRHKTHDPERPEGHEGAVALSGPTGMTGIFVRPEMGANVSVAPSRRGKEVPAFEKLSPGGPAHHWRIQAVPIKSKQHEMGIDFFTRSCKRQGKKQIHLIRRRAIGEQVWPPGHQFWLPGQQFGQQFGLPGKRCGQQLWLPGKQCGQQLWLPGKQCGQQFGLPGKRCGQQF